MLQSLSDCEFELIEHVFDLRSRIPLISELRIRDLHKGCGHFIS